jgi:hypothetical protein
MAKDRQLNRIKPGEYQATCFWREGTGIEERMRYAEHAGIKVDEKWGYIYLRDGEETVKLSRTRNQSAQVYVGKSLRDAMRERIANRVTHSLSPGYEQYEGESEQKWCCGDGCTIHTPEWLEQEIGIRLSNAPCCTAVFSGALEL